MAENKKLIISSNDIVPKISSFLQDNTLDPNSCMFFNDISTIMNHIERIKAEFESNMFFIVAAGAIKSGKSTLINLLTHKNVSTTKLGKETTLRPAIICSAREDKILLFTTSKSPYTKEDENEVFDMAIDYIKGFITKDELNDKYKIKVSEQVFNSTNIAKYLTTKEIIGQSEPILVNIQVSINKEQFPSSLLNNDVVLIDTPGIDGILAGAEGLKDSGQNFALMNRVDLMLFLQSSVTPINKESCDYITNLKHEHKITNMRLVHNKFTLKPWRDKLNIEQTNTDQQAIEATKKVFKNITDNIKHNVVDFAKAEDGYIYQEKQLLDESGFELFEKELYDDIKDNKKDYQENRVKESFKLLINQNIGLSNSDINIKVLEKKIKQQENEWENEEKQFIDILNTIGEFFENNHMVLRLIEEPKQENQDIDHGWNLQSIVEYTKSDFCPSTTIDITKGLKGSQLLKTLEDVADAENRSLLRKLDNSVQFNKFIQHTVIFEDKSISMLLDQFNSLRTDIQMESFKLKIDMDRCSSSIAINADQLYHNVKTYKDFVPLIKLNDEQIRTLKENCKTEIRKEAFKLVDEFSINLHNEIKEQFAIYKEKLDLKKEELRELLNEKRVVLKDKLNNTKIIQQNIYDFFINIEKEL